MAKIQAPHIELTISGECEHMCTGICGAASTASGIYDQITPQTFNARVLKPLTEAGLKPPMVTLTGGSVSLPKHRGLLIGHLDQLKEQTIPTKLSTTLVWENDSFFRMLAARGYNIPRIHTSFRDPSPAVTQAQDRFPDTGPMVLKNLKRVVEHRPDTFVEVESLISTTLAPHLPEIGHTLVDTMKPSTNWEWQLQTLKASGNAQSLDLAVLGTELNGTLSFLENQTYLEKFNAKGIKLLCMPPVCTPAGRYVNDLINNSNGVIYTTRCTEGQVSTEEGVPSGVVYISSGRDIGNNTTMVMRPCFITCPPNESALPDLLKEDVVETYTKNEFLVGWRNEELVPSICGDCKEPHGSLDAQHTKNCVPNCRASTASLDATGNLKVDLLREPTQVELEYRRSRTN